MIYCHCTATCNCCALDTASTTCATETYTITIRSSELASTYIYADYEPRPSRKERARIEREHFADVPAPRLPRLGPVRIPGMDIRRFIPRQQAR